MMRIPLIEPVSPRYIHINPITNHVHLMVPVIGGQEISTDNTCKTTAALREFFDGEALGELNAYKDKLLFDIGLLEVTSSVRKGKEARLIQIESYIKAIPAMQYRYSGAITALLKKASNLYSIQLRPRAQDVESKVVNPAFTIERRNDTKGIPLSPLYRIMHDTFLATKITTQDPRAQLVASVLTLLPTSPCFEDIQRILQTQCQVLFGLTIDFTKRMDGTPATKSVIDELMYFENNETVTQQYIDVLLGSCALNLWESISAPPFYTLPEQVEERTERLSILTQFFFANLNVYCRSKGISLQNFGVILDATSRLSEDMVLAVSQALTAGTDVEQVLCDFCNAHSAEFQLSRLLNEADIVSIKQKFARTWRTISTGENRHMDDFMILDIEASDKTNVFVTHQGAICVNFAEIAAPCIANQTYFKQAREDFANHPIEIPHRNESIENVLEIEPETLLARINDAQLDKLPEHIKAECRTYPGYQIHHFLHDVAKGRQQKAESLLTQSENAQNLLKTQGKFTDYSGRTFNCTAYEYAYWAKDTHMCRMLEPYMDEETKAHLLKRITEMERIGLEYQQHGRTYRSAHFDLGTLKKELLEYANNYDYWRGERFLHYIQDALIQVSKAQRDVPAHVIQEYCRPDRSFEPLPQFSEATLPRALTCFNVLTQNEDTWFPLTADFELVLTRAQLTSRARANSEMLGWVANMDLKAITRLDEVRTANLAHSIENLKPVSTSEFRLTL